jgi:capsular exopolysaccharide synthesis family protein
MLGVAIGLIGAVGVTHLTPSVYTSSTRLFVGTTTSPDNAAAYAGGLFSEQRVASYVELLKGQRLSGEVIGELGLRTTPAELASGVTTQVLPNTVIIEVTVADRSARQAQAIADAYGRHFTEDVTSLETAAGQSTATVKVSTVQPADLDPTPISPDPVRNVALGALLGLVLGVVVGLLAAHLDPSVSNPRLAQELTRSRVLGTLLEEERGGPPGGPTALGRGPTAMRALRGFALATQSLGVRVVVVTSPVGGEGRSTVALSLAGGLARSGSRVVLVDADLRARRSPEVVDRPGLTDVLTGKLDLAQTVRSSGDAMPSVLPRGSTVADPGAVLGSPGIHAMMEALRGTYDHVIIDAPPAVRETDLLELGRHADGCLLVARFGATRRDELAAAAASLSRHGVALLGTVLNRVPERVAVARGWCHRYEPDPGRRTTLEGRGGVPPLGQGPPSSGSSVLPVPLEVP